MSALYKQVCDQLLDAITSGALKVGDKLPPEAEYAATLGVSRSTLRLAFAELEANGVLQRRKRAGTQIISAKPKPRFNMSTTGLDELLSLGRDTELVIARTRDVRTQDVAQLHGLISDTDLWLEVDGTRTLKSETTSFSVNRIYVPARFAAIEPLLDTCETSVFRVIEDTFNVSVGRVSQLMRAIPCPDIEAGLMGLAPAAPVLQIEARLYTKDGMLMEVSLATFDPARFQVRTDVTVG